VPKTALEMRKRGHLAGAIEKIIFQNPKKFLRQSRTSSCRHSTLSE